MNAGQALFAVFLLTAAPAMATAQTAFYRVVGVSRGDELNIRAQPDAESEILGRIPPDARRIRGFGCSDDTPSRQAWCRIKYGDVVGWVRHSFLRYE